MNAPRTCLVGGLAAALLVAGVAATGRGTEQQFTLARAVPNDVFVCVAERHNPEREFLDRYWGEVFEALKQCGIGEDLLELIGSLLGEDEMAEVQRLKQRASELLAGVDWKQLVSGETVFAERFPTPGQAVAGDNIVLMPDMVFLSRGSGEGADRNFDGLTAILESIAEELNNAAGSDALAVVRTSRSGTKIASVNLLAMIPAAPSLSVAVAQRDDLVLIALGESMLSDVLDLLDGNGSKKALTADPRFKAAFAKLPAAEDCMTFFDMQALLKRVQALLDMVVGTLAAPGDVYLNTGMDREANMLNARALAAYRSGEIKQALALTEQAHEAAPKDSVVLYNLACFNALLGNQDEALSWLQKAVEGGFYAPAKIDSDPDLDSLRGQPRYEVAHAKAVDLAAQCCAEDIVINSSKRGEAYKLCEQAWDVYKQRDYEQGLRLIEQAYEVTPTDSRVLYYLSCFHALLGHQDKALHFLAKAVDGGFYCPTHIAKDPDLQSIRGDERYEAALAKARQKAAGLGAKQRTGKPALVKEVINRLMNAVGILDYIAAVESTDGYTVRVESIAALVPDAKDRPIYPVFAKRDQLTDFDRYLPRETASFSVSGCCDLGELYKFIEDTIRLVSLNGNGLLAKWEEFQATLGLDVEKDVIGWIEGDSVSVTLEDNQGSVWLIKVNNEQVAREKVAAALEFLSNKALELAGANPVFAMLSVSKSPAEHERLDGFEQLHFAMSPQPIVWGVADGHLIFSTSADAVAMCLDTAKGTHPGIRENARAMTEAIVPTGPFTSVTLTDQRALGNELAKGIGVASMLGGMMGAFIPDPKARPVITKIAGMLAKLTPAVRKIDFYKSTATHTTFDGRAWYTRTVTNYVSPEERARSGTQ